MQKQREVLIQATELAALPRDAVLVLDCRFSLTDPAQGRRDFESGHIPDAAYAGLNDDLSDLSKVGEGRHPLPDPARFARALARWGWQPGRAIVAYDGAGATMAAARAWWMADSAGIPARVLDGGWQAWQAAGLPVTIGSGAVARNAEPTKLAFNPACAVSYVELETRRRMPSTLIIDARSAPRYRGEHEPIDPVAGHVPGARNRPCALNLAPDGRFKDAATLHAEFSALLARRAPADVVHMCGSGVFACQNQLAMEIAGLPRSRVFVPSWSGWVSDPKRAVATGDAE